MKTFSVLFLVIFLSSRITVAQVTEDFSDGEFSSDPSWVGSPDSFIVNGTSQLQLNSTAAGTSWLSTDFPAPQLEEVEWEILVKQSFAPSAANFGRFYLVSDQTDLSSSLNGYYLQFGEAGADDAVELFRQSGANRVSVCRGVNGMIATSFSIRVKVTRDSQGLWKLFVDQTGGRDFALEASGTDPGQVSSLYSGMLCTYTITNATRFYYDDIVINSVKSPDQSPPQIVALEVTSAQSLTIIFSEDLDSVTSENHLNYFVSPTPGNAASSRLMDDHKTVELSFSQAFKNGEPSAVTVNGIADLSGNIMPESQKAFLFFVENPVGYRDIIITEICADPSPALGLPEAEFVELFNRSEYPVDLAGWQLSDEATTGRTESVILLPGKYVVVTGPVNIGKFSPFGEVVSATPFPSLNNSGDVLTLKNVEGKTIDSLRYDISWYRDSEKADGGWSLELIDTQNICADRSNWASAEASSGGTPAQQNSISATKPDTTGPKVESVALFAPDSLLIQFDEKLEEIVPSPDQFIINPAVEIKSVNFGDESLSSIVLLFSAPAESSKSYSLQITDVYDCPGNKIRQEFATAVFVLPEKAARGDIIINEILFNPSPTGVDFVEIYNRSAKTIDLHHWTLRNFDGAARNSSVIADKNTFIRPQQYKVFTPDVDILKGEYINGKEETFHETDLPALNDDDGSVTLTDGEGQIIDSMAYNVKMHVPFVGDAEGISLERISFDISGEMISNWRSASSTSGFATPGYVNSNVRAGLPIGSEPISVEPEIFRAMVSANSFARIIYRFDRGGFMANVRIFDPHGRPIKVIAENQLLGAEGFFRWDGDHDNGAVARRGYYFVWCEIFDGDGNVRTFRKRVAIY